MARRRPRRRRHTRADQPQRGRAHACAEYRALATERREFAGGPTPARGLAENSRAARAHHGRRRRALFFAQAQNSALVRLNHIHLAEARRRTAVADRVDLLRLTLAVVGRAPLLPIAGSGDQVERLPEVGSARLVGDPRNHPLLLAVLDLPKGVAAELEIVALLVDREAAIAIDQDAVVHAGDQVVDTRPRLARLQPNVGHALERNAGPVVGIAAAARFALADQMGLVADGLVVFENALLDDGKLGGFHSIVVEARGGQTAIGGAIAPYIHQVAANAQRAHLVRGQKAGAGEVGLVAQGAIQLRGMPDALVNGEPEMARHQHQVLLAGCRWLGINTRSFLPGVTGGALRCSITSVRMRCAFSTRFISGTYSYPAVTCWG